MEYYGESASSFAEKIGVQRSSISHILSGRNKPSLDFVLKMLHAYPEVDLYWLFNGRGSFPPESEPLAPPTEPLKNLPPNTGLFKDLKTKKSEPEEKSIERIVIFYTDGTFKNFQN